MRVTKLTAVSAAALFTLSMSACGDAEKTGSAVTPATAVATTPATQASSAPTMTEAQFGAGCSQIPTDPNNKGSFEAMAKEPVATAASGNPLLSTLVTAVGKAGLGDSLNKTPALTIFAPVNDAFAAIPKATLDKVLADKAMLTDVLTYHAVAGRLDPAELAGTHETLQGEQITIAGSGSDFKVNGAASVVCGNVQTANATVYIIDGVLMPKKG